MQQRKYLVTGATGKTGVYTIRHLLDGGHAVRAFVHQEDERSAALQSEGAEIFVGDLLEHDDIIRASGGGHRRLPVTIPCVLATFRRLPILPMQPGEPASRSLWKCRRFLLGKTRLSHAARDHWIAERVLDWSGVPTVHIRPTFFSEWLIFPWVLDQIKKENKITLPYGTGRHATHRR